MQKAEYATLSGHTNDPGRHLASEIHVANSVLHALQHMLLVEQSVSVVVTPGWQGFHSCQASATGYVQEGFLRSGHRCCPAKPHI